MPDGTPEIYNAVQGEGLTMGLPTVFVRLSQCNLMCNFCDTFYTWYFSDTKIADDQHTTAKKVNRDDYQMQMTTDQVAEQINKVRGGHRNIVFTGGEPLLQQMHINEVMDKLRSDGAEWHFEVETNGTMKILNPFAERISQINCSPKLKSSGNTDAMRIRPEAIARILEVGTSPNKALCFKFVVFKESWESDLAEIEQWERENNVPRKYIWLMPEGTKRERIQESTAFLNEIAESRGYNVSTRLQILVYGDKRAV